MAHSSNIFDSQPIRVQNVNGFDLSHLNCGTAICGTLTPVLCRLLMQDTTFDLGVSLQVELPPLATNFFGRIDANIEVFFVPCSILYGGWKQFISNQAMNMFPQRLPGLTTTSTVESFALPRFNLSDSSLLQEVGNLVSNQYCLLDYLGCMSIVGIITDSGTTEFNIMSLLAYHRIWDCYYRNPQVTKTIFSVNPNHNSTTYNTKNVSLIWHSFYSYDSAPTETQSVSRFNPLFTTSASLTFPDGLSIFSMRQRNYPRDYFTAASLMPQQVPSGGTVATLGFTVAGIDPNSPDSSGNLSGSGAFTLASLRAVNALGKFMESCNYDPTYEGIMRAHFGRTPSDADHDKPIYIGRCVVPIYQKSIYNTQQDTSGSAASGSNANAFSNSGTLGSKGAHGSFIGEGQICKGFRAGCFGYLMGIFSLVPHAMYSSGIDKHFTLLNIGDFPFPELQGVGMDAIRESEIFYDTAQSFDVTFGYLPRYSYWKYIDDTVHGLLRPGSSLESFALQRRFSASPQQISTSFCEIPTNALDSVFATTVDVSHFSCWYEIFWVFKATMPLAAFCVPTLGELQDTHTIKVAQGGSKL